MNERLLLEAATTLGYRLAMSGAETFRVEETIQRVLKTYGYDAEAFAIPNCLTVSIRTATQRVQSRDSDRFFIGTSQVKSAFSLPHPSRNVNSTFLLVKCKNRWYTEVTLRKEGTP